MSEISWRRLFLSGAWFNWVVAASFALWHREMGAALGVRPAAEPAIYLHLFCAAVAIFGYGYYLVSRDLTQRAIVLLGAIAKLAVVVISFAYWAAGIASWHLPALTGVDLVYAIFFIAFLRQTGREAGSAAQRNA